MVVNVVSVVQYNGEFLPDIVLLTLRYYDRGDCRRRNWWSFILCIRNRNSSQEPDSETRDINKRQKTRAIKRVQ